MTMISTCPEDHELLPVATGEAIGRHLDACPTCRGRVERLRAELTALRQDLGAGAGPAAAADPEPFWPEAITAPAGTRSSTGSAEAPRSGSTPIRRARTFRTTSR